MLFSGYMAELDARSSLDVFQRVVLPVIFNSTDGGIVDAPFVVGISMWVKSYLLFCITKSDLRLRKEFNCGDESADNLPMC